MSKESIAMESSKQKDKLIKGGHEIAIGKKKT
jgi:hypothetical protein